ncbi:hypothetical protein ScPMuIL_009806 [Solemya velum]
MASVSYHIANLLEKMTSNDKDFRFMATNDLMTDLQKDSIKLDDDSERKVVKMLLKLLEDKNGEVQNLAVKCLGPLVNKVKEFQVESIVDTLCSNMLSDKEQLRDISSIGLKTVISELSPTSTALAAGICKKITGRLTNAIAKQEDMSVQLEALDILGDLLSRFGGLLVGFHVSILQSLLPQLSSPRLAVRKRAIIAIGYLVMGCNNTLFMELIDFLLVELGKNSSTSTTRTYIQCIGAISRQAGHRFGEHMEKIVPLIVGFCREDDDELREYCLQAFESFNRRCPKEISPFVTEIINICLKYICYDPNYNYDDDDDSMETEAEEEEEDGSNEEYSDDDDMSWKVRRAAAKCLDAIIGTRIEMLGEFYRTVSPSLISRFKEREENVKSDIFHAYITLLRQTRPSASSDPEAMDQGEGPVSMLQTQILDIVKAMHKQLKEKSVKTRQGCFSLLTELVMVLPGALADHLPALVPGIQYSLGDKNSSSNMKIDTLSFLNCILIHHHPSVFHPHVKILVSPIVHAVGDPFYKITSEALLVTQQLVKVIRPLGKFLLSPRIDFELFCSVYCDIYRSLEKLLSALVHCVRQLADTLIEEWEESLRLTSGTSLEVFLIVVRQLLQLEVVIYVIKSYFRRIIRASEMSSLIRKFMIRGRSGMSFSRYALLRNLRTLATSVGCSISRIADILLGSALMAPSVIICPWKVISFSPIAILSLLSTIFLSSHLLNNMSNFLLLSWRADLSSVPWPATIMSSAIVNMPSRLSMFLYINIPTKQYSALLLRFVQSLCKMFELLSTVLKYLQSPTDFAEHGNMYSSYKHHTTLRCLVGISPSGALRLVNEPFPDLKNAKSSDSVKLFSLLSLGEIGKHIDLGSHSDIQNVVLESFLAQTEEVKGAASFALGNISVGNLTRFLPFVLKEIEEQPKLQYLLLHSLKEIISCESSSTQGVDALRPYVQTIWSMLFTHCECPEEGTRNVVSECLGKLTLIDPKNLLNNLKQHLDHPSALTRSTVVTAIKFTISDQPQAIDPLLRNCFGDFLKSLQDTDLNVRQVALVTFNSAAHKKPSLIRDLLDTVLPHLYNETKVRRELIREVEMGPFKHTLDDGLDIRKAAFECMYTMLESCLDRLDIFEFLNHVEDGLKDHYDIKMLTYLMLVRLAHLCPNAVLQRLDRLVEPLRATCTTKVKAHSVKQEFEKQDELKRSAMRAVASLLAIPDADKSPQMNEFLAQIKSSSELEAMFESIQKDALATLSDAVVMDTS